MHIVVNQPMGVMFPTQDFFKIVIVWLHKEVLPCLLSSHPEPLLLISTLVWDSRKAFMPTTLHGNGNRSIESVRDDTKKLGGRKLNNNLKNQYKQL